MLLGRRRQAVWACSPAAWEQGRGGEGLGGPERVAAGKRALGMAWSFVVLFFVGERTLGGGTSPGGSTLLPNQALGTQSLCAAHPPNSHVEALTLHVMYLEVGPAHPQRLTPGH